jgi:uncharacterized protein involved in outer membrane biogenesis
MGSSGLWLRRATIAAAAAAGLILLVWIGVDVVLPRRLPGWIERHGSAALGRAITIGGPIELTILPALGASARDVALANPRGFSRPEMARVGRVAFKLDLGSLWKGRLRFREIVVEDARIDLERDAAGLPNWVFELPPRAPKPAAERREPFIIERATVRDFELTFRRRPDAVPLRAGVEAVDASLDPATLMVELAARGHLNDAPWEIEGKLGTLDRLYEARDVEHALTGRIGGSTISIRGRIRDPFSLGGPNMEIDVEGPDAARTAAALGAKLPDMGSYSIHAALKPAEPGIAGTVAVAIGELTASVRGTVGDLLHPAKLGASVEVAGKDASRLGAWIGVPELPARPISVTGRVRRDGASLALEEIAVHVGGTTLRLDGTLGPPPRCVGTSFAVSGSGADASELSPLTRLRLPARPFTIEGRFLRRADGLAIEKTTIKIAGTTIDADGTIGEPPALADLDLAFSGSGPDLSVAAALAGTALPAERFTVQGSIARAGSEYALRRVRLTLADDAGDVDAMLVPAPRAAGSSLIATVSGPDLARATARWGAHGLPAVPYRLSCSARILDEAVDLAAVDARAGSLALSAHGRLAFAHALAGSSLAGTISAPALSDLEAWGAPRGMLPAARFSLAADLGIDARGLRIDRAAGVVGNDRVSAQGRLGSPPLSEGLALDIAAEGKSLAFVDRRLPDVAYSVRGTLRHAPTGVALERVAARIAETDLRVDGVVGAGEKLAGTDLTFKAEAPDPSLLGRFVPTALPEGALAAGGRIALDADAIHLDRVSVAIDEAKIEASGLLGRGAQLAGTDLTVTASGPDLSEILGPMAGISPAPEDPFHVTAHVAGSLEQFASNDLAATLGASDIRGRGSVKLTPPRSLELSLASQRIDAGHVLEEIESAPPADAPEPAPPPPKKKKKKPKKEKGELAIPDTPLSLGLLGDLTARVHLAAGELALPASTLHDVLFDATLADRVLHVGPIAGTGANGGRAKASLDVTREGDGFRARFEGHLDDVRLVLGQSGASPEDAPKVDLDVTVDGAGRSLHEIASSASGRVLLVAGSGKVPNTLGDRATGGLFDAINPFRKSSPFTALECAIASATIDGGKAAIEPVALRTDRMTVVGKGAIDFATEDLDVTWTIKPRRGVGITASSIANPYIKLGGTLSAPSIEARPMEAAASTGAAVATGGLTLLFKGIYDRITAEGKVCVKALEKAKKNEQAQAAKRAAAPAQ